MASSFNKEIRRSIRQTLGRFIAIAVIAALGAGFYAGLRMTAPDMKLAADEYFDGTNLMDIRVMSSLGLDDDSIAALSAVEGVEAVMPAYESDAMAQIDGSQYVVRIHSLDTQAAQESSLSNSVEVSSDDETYINRLILVEGSWPTSADECLLGAGVVMDTEVAIGDTVTLLEGTQDLDETFTTSEFKVVGFVQTAYYTSTTSLGSTSLGSGSIDQFIYVPTDSFSEDTPYTEAFLTVEGARDEAASSQEYDDLVAQVVERIEALSPTLAAERLAAIQDAAQEELDEQWARYESERDEALAQLEEAKAELDDAAAQLSEAAATLSSSEEELAAGQKEYDDGLSQLENQRASALAQLDAAQSSLDAGRSAYDEAQVTRASLATQLEQAQSALAEIDSQVPDISAAQTQVGEGLEQVEAALAQLEQAGATQEDSRYKALIEQQAELQTQASQLEELAQQRASLVEGIAVLEDGINQIDQQTEGLSSDYFDEAQAVLDTQRAQTLAQLDAAQAALDEAAAELLSGRTQLESGKSDYEEGLAEYLEGQSSYEEGVQEAYEGFAQAEEELASAQQEIDEIESPQIYVLDRSKLIGAESFESDANRIDQIAQLFPFIFFLVAALVSLTTMTRMVDEERVLIGTHKALGFSKAKITSKYLIYAFIASGIGALVGIGILTQFLPYFIMRAYSIVYAVPVCPTPINLPIALLSVGLSLGITLAATWAAAASTLRETPAALMQPRAPKAGKRILLEYIRPLWRKLSFSWKVTTRNIFRYKQRFFMAVVGIAGCTALLLTGLGLQNAINDIIDKQFYQIYQYNMVVRIDADDQDAQSETQAMLEAETTSDNACIESHLWLHTANVIAKVGDSDEQQVELVVPEDDTEIANYVLMRERVGHASLSLGSDGAVISEKLANELGLSLGDEIEIYQQDDVGNATGEAVSIRVAGIMENYVSQYLFLSAKLYTEAFGMDPAWDTVYVQATEDEDQRSRLSDEFLALEGVETLSFNDEQIDSYRTMLKSVDSIVVVLIVAAAILAFVVLYNLSNINITERAREIATLKVLGFTRGEVDAYIFRETLILSIIGALAGLVFGIFLEAFVVQTAEVDQVMFGREIHRSSFLIAFALTLVFTVLVMLVMRGKLMRIDMVESLKSNE